ncbi:hypothetical protein MTR62_11885 [Novosphingobium sp. 1949]|uniref:Peroxidase n=1 Tax=Novosphingobium organovorum TaxID=2930092 RepID=A0ABT0BE96_9SPHN|nr:peroxidase family protein [Novosphingobium organovorum]MCJ2183385.1 hypothetical protein [Novosphingobium organovorum]
MAVLMRAKGRAEEVAAAFCPPMRQGNQKAAAKPVRAGDAVAVEATVKTLVSHTMYHGGIHTLLDKGVMEMRAHSLARVLPAGVQEDFVAASLTLPAQVAVTFFGRLVPDKPYLMRSQLVSYLSYPGRHLTNGEAGIMFAEDDADSSIDASITFIGQFIDHDLTRGALNLFDTAVRKSYITLHPDLAEALAEEPDNEASPFIDLDSVYGGRRDPEKPHCTITVPMDEATGQFELKPVAGGGFDVVRDSTSGMALIGDGRNDENQIVLQVHILLMRVHNAYVEALKAKAPALDANTTFKAAREKTILTWQAYVLHHYLPAVCRADYVDCVKARILADPMSLVHHPDGGDPRNLTMPHEFGIGFRFGHSQIRNQYRMNRHSGFPLFDSLSDGSNDLRGGKPLDASRIIDWGVFVQQPSKLIDTKVSQVAFDLPQSAVPDGIKLVGNLPFRNLQRSNDVELCCGEDLAELYAKGYAGACSVPVYSRLQIDKQRPDLFYLDNDGKRSATFRTPLWFYLLREAELARGGDAAKGQLGPLGSLLVAEVILNAIYHAPISIFKEGLADDTLVTFESLVAFAEGKGPPPLP